MLRRRARSLVYNLEFTELHYLLNDVLSDVLRDPHRTLAMHPLGNLARA